MKAGLFILLLLLLTACASENLYEGFKTREAMHDPVPGQNARSTLPTYQDYESEREKLLDRH